MALDRVIKEHVKEQDAIEEAAREDLDKIIEAIDINAVMTDPQGALSDVAEAVEELIIAKYFKEANQSGIEMAKRIKKMKRDIVIQDTDDADINKESAKVLLENRQND